MERGWIGGDDEKKNPAKRLRTEVRTPSPTTSQESNDRYSLEGNVGSDLEEVLPVLIVEEVRGLDEARHDQIQDVIVISSDEEDDDPGNKNEPTTIIIISSDEEDDEVYDEEDSDIDYPYIHRSPSEDITLLNPEDDTDDE